MSRTTIVVALLSLLSVAPIATAQERQVYFGMLHSHTHYSDGVGDPEDAYDSARDAGLDFFALTEHNHHQAAGDDGVFLTPTLYHELRETAREKTIEGEFLAIYGQEVSTISKGNHENVFFASEIVDMPNGDFKYLYEDWMPRHREAPFIQLNHPNRSSSRESKDYGIDDYDGEFSQLVAACDQYVKLIEVIKGGTQTDVTTSPHQQGQYADEYFWYLNKGFHLSPSVGGDEHRDNWGKSMHARMGVWAEELTINSLVEAILNHHTYASEDDSIIVQFSANDAIMGSTISLPSNGVINLNVAFHDSNEPDARHRVQVFYDDGIEGEVAREIEDEVFSEGVSQATFSHVGNAGGYYIVKVVQIGDHADDVWTAPIWIRDTGVLLADAEETQPMAENTDDPRLDVIAWTSAPDYVNEETTVVGKVIRAHNYRDEIIFFNFDENYEDSLSLVIFADNFAAFGGAQAIVDRLVNRNVKIKGTITLYRDTRMQIVLESPEQIIAVEGE